MIQFWQAPFRVLARYLWRPLLVRVLALTVIFLLLAEGMIFIPSLARYHQDRLQNRLAMGQLAVLALEQAGTEGINPELKRELLANAEVRMVALRRDQTKQLFLAEPMPPGPVVTVETRDLTIFRATWQAFETLFAGEDRIIRIIGQPRKAGGEFIEAIVDEAPLRAEMIAYFWRIFTLSLIIAAVTAVPVYFALRFALVNPIRHITDAMMRFQERPEDAGRIVVPLSGEDEIARASRALAAMQTQLRQALAQKEHLAALGLAVAKIQHDLRNILSSAQLASDRLIGSNDPEVKKFAPRIMQAVDRAIALATHTLKYGRAEEDPPRRKRFALSDIADEVMSAALSAGQGRVAWENAFDPTLEVDADQSQLVRMMLNISRNAVQALENKGGGTVRVSAERIGDHVTIDIADNGSGLPQHIKDHLFEPFQSRNSSGGTGLGLAIARELARGHGGDVSLLRTGDEGTVFRILLPDSRALARNAGVRPQLERPVE